MESSEAVHIYRVLGILADDIDRAQKSISSPYATQTYLAAAADRVTAIREQLARAYQMPPETDADGNRIYYGELRSGNFGPDTSRYHVYVRLYAGMRRYQDPKTGQGEWTTRAAAWAATADREPPVAVVGIPTDSAKSTYREPSV